MATNFQSSSRSKREDPLTKLVQLLDEKQPYEEFERLRYPDLDIGNTDKLLRIQGSLVGLAIGDALGASVEFRPYSYLQQNKVTDMQTGGTWGLKAGQWTDDTSMALCLAASLIVKGEFDPYDQFIRYKRWYKDGYMSSTGLCFDIGKSTRQAIIEFEKRQTNAHCQLIQSNQVPKNTPLDKITKQNFLSLYKNLECGPPDSAGNGALMRVAPIPLFFSESYDAVKKCIDEATTITHNDQRAIEACQFYAGLIWHAINGVPKEQLLDPNFYRDVLCINLSGEVLKVVQGSYKNKKGYEDGIRGKGYVVNSLEAALWAFYKDGSSFNEGVLLAVNLGDDTDTTAAIYGELAGAVYGIKNISSDWINKLFQEKFIKTVAKALYVTGQKFKIEQQQSNEPNRDHRNHHPRSANNKESSDRKSHETDTLHSNQNASANNASNYGQSTTSKNASDRNQARNTHKASHRDGRGNVNNALHDEGPAQVINE
ncbi:unnamed protein product [Rotaria sp. Silwood2]|nr:unnamed protein product [Rotaria sp. Silwood2]CAF2644835.1 unnamed protein product [Rotaria sp. Silwood2]CAF2907846.1 unnamed protein product [Rotaria sp. Silwood2]CAF3058622.1 unnamed protein product [Rotaria sp. Silwood2]CAF3851932.1 unnamed protein product [Rotaria sp. Silwood2]